MPKENALAVMPKARVEGEVKPRLTPPLTPKEAAILYKAFIKDTFSRLSKLTDLALYAFFTPFDKKAYIVDIIPQEISLIPHKDGDLGVRVGSQFGCLFNSGHHMAAIMGSDSPDIPLEYI